jgi:hypothetical protein
VLTAVRADLLEDWTGFLGAPSTCLEPDPVVVLGWAAAAVAVNQFG